MRVYQFRHIRADAQCSRAPTSAKARKRTYHGASETGRPPMRSSVPGRPSGCVGPRPHHRRYLGRTRPGRGHARSAGALARDLPGTDAGGDAHARSREPAHAREPLLSADARRSPALAAVADRDALPGRTVRLELQRRAQRLLGRAPPRPGRPPDLRTRSPDRLAEPALPAAPRPQRQADQGQLPLRRRSADHGPGTQDRRRRRRNRLVAPVLQPGRLRAASGLPQGRPRGHERQGDRRARVPAALARVAQRRTAVRPAPLRARHPRGGNRGR